MKRFWSVRKRKKGFQDRSVRFIGESLLGLDPRYLQMLTIGFSDFMWNSFSYEIDLSQELIGFCEYIVVENGCQR